MQSFSNWVGMTPTQQSVYLDEVILRDALWQLWLSIDAKDRWIGISKEERLSLLQYLVEESIWWNEFIIQEKKEWKWESWPWQKQYAFLRTAGREAIHLQLEHPIDGLAEPNRAFLLSQMEDFGRKWDEEWAPSYSSPHVVPPIYANCNITLI